jgi:poly(ADP-ribose) glycohydrolase ARH3
MDNKEALKYQGTILGLALGDALGAPYEGGVLERALWRLLGAFNRSYRWTDDTQMSIDLIEHLLEYKTLNQNQLAIRFAKSYRFSKGYGPGAAKVLKLIAQGVPWQQANTAIYKEGSFGNGGAMRAPVIGLLFAKDIENNETQLVEFSSAVASITHAHPLGIDGAVLIALTTAYAFNDIASISILQKLLEKNRCQQFNVKLTIALNWFKREEQPPVKKVREQLGNGISAIDSCVSAIYCALLYRNSPFEDLIKFVISLKGDVDTIGSMSGAIWGSFRGYESLPSRELSLLEDFAHLNALASAYADFCKKY